ncbi:hypothetical protein NPX79_00655 [Spiroplasma endosymbiont of Anurida maritima]|uniref:hypothetical protein n=1 Tax=Spiroplasma endosymbiont of Anurida maritima TaxID=2967972 RepID=UPI0036D2C14D
MKKLFEKNPFKVNKNMLFTYFKNHWILLLFFTLIYLTISLFFILFFLTSTEFSISQITIIETSFGEEEFVNVLRGFSSPIFSSFILGNVALFCLGFLHLFL